VRLNWCKAMVLFAGDKAATPRGTTLRTSYVRFLQPYDPSQEP
jgi:hypothetical protein